MYRRMDDFRTEWTEEAGKTLTVFDAIPDGALGAVVTEGHRDVRRIAWHLVECLIEMPGHMGLQITGREMLDGSFIKEPPTTMAEIRAAYGAASDSLLKAIEGWGDADLEREDSLYGEIWPRGRTLSILLVHQTHHRGQMTVLMRQAGLKVPGVYGPAREDWAAYNMEPPKV
jgi:uncharacterized damage-inducible protein DinB